MALERRRDIVQRQAMVNTFPVFGDMIMPEIQSSVRLIFGYEPCKKLGYDGASQCYSMNIGFVID